jgi:hypothetical protein
MNKLKTSVVGLFPTLPPVGVSISNLAKGACGEQRRHDSDGIRRTTDGGKLLESPAVGTQPDEACRFNWSPEMRLCLSQAIGSPPARAPGEPQSLQKFLNLVGASSV